MREEIAEKFEEEVQSVAVALTHLMTVEEAEASDKNPVDDSDSRFFAAAEPATAPQS